MNKDHILIKLINLNDEIKEELNKRDFLTTSSNLNGLMLAQKEEREIRFYNKTPRDLHEMDYIIVSNQLTSNQISDELSNTYIKLSQGRLTRDLTALDMNLLRREIFKSPNEQCIIFFADKYNEESYEIFDKLNPHIDSKMDTDNLGFPFFPRLAIENRGGTIFKRPPEDVRNKSFIEITELLLKYEEGSYFGTVYPSGTTYAGKVLLLSKAGEIIAKYEKEGFKHFFYLPMIKDKKNFLIDLFTKVLPESNFPYFKETLSEYGSFKWVTDSAYISRDEMIKRDQIADEINRHKQKVEHLNIELDVISKVPENVWVKKLLTAHSDALVQAVVSFFKFLEFENITVPDDAIDNTDETLLEEDINIAFKPQLTLIIECKGLGGTSKDSECSQPDKIALRRRKEAHKNGIKDHTFRPFYIVNHQRFKSPELRENPPFREPQIDNAEMCFRGMTTTYELFKVHHMIQAGVLSKEEARECFLQIGLIDFRVKLRPLYNDENFPSAKVYSFDLKKTPGSFIKNNGKLILEDNDNHWHVLDIKGLQVSRENVLEATDKDTASAGVKVNKYIRNIKNFYTI